MNKSPTFFFSALALLLGLPFLGLFTAGIFTVRYLEFPPKTLYIQPAPFSWIFFFFYSLVLLAMILPIALTGGRLLMSLGASAKIKGTFPWWGWAGIIFNGASWVVAWTRIPAFSPIQPHTFFPLWFSYILVVNALRMRRDGECMITRKPAYFVLLFPASAAFWWFFEYLNRFVQNWHYTGVSYGPFEYAALASLSFSTVLPAVLGTREWLLGVRWIREGFVSRPVTLKHLGKIAWSLLILAGLGLFGIGIWPNFLFPLLWASPLLIVLSFQILGEKGPLLNALLKGDLRPAVSAALAALVCGFFWEMWNFFSLAKWMYRIPYVHRFEIFEMPVLGYAGYLPFGLECALAGDLAARLLKNDSGKK